LVSGNCPVRSRQEAGVSSLLLSVYFEQLKEDAYMLVVKQGSVKHDGVAYTKGQPLPEMSMKDSHRLIELGACLEGVAAMIAADEAAKPISIPIVDGIARPLAGPVEVGGPVNLNFDLADSIRGVKRR
jgi:hypothetical protein